MPVYVQCPYCEHPRIVAAPRRGKAVYCRQCGMPYQTSILENKVRPLALATVGESVRRQAAGGKVYVIDI
ncbi:MAG: hypothetical protein GXY55_17230 [Phycisphaerae bacterium]|nr:hypothetical protein [Phycisphaerae bacterium]